MEVNTGGEIAVFIQEVVEYLDAIDSVNRVGGSAEKEGDCVTGVVPSSG